MTRYNILVTGVGAIIGYGILSSLRQSSLNLKLIGTDIYENTYGETISDDFFINKPANSQGYIEFINRKIEEKKIDLVIPGIEQDLYIFAQNRKKLKTKVVLNNELCIKLSQNKLLTFRYLRKNSDFELISTLFKPDFYECKAKLGLPFLVKPISGYASKGIKIVKTEDEFCKIGEELANVICQKITGDKTSEYTISLFGDGKGNILDSIILKRRLSKEGATSFARVVEADRRINSFIKNIVRLLKPIGPTNVQLIKDKDVPYLLEINPRVSSACSIRTAFGYNEPEMCVNFYLKNVIPEKKPKKRGTAIRYIADSIIYE
jgi:carbamoyl-phosphate synthase large subunit